MPISQNQARTRIGELIDKYRAMSALDKKQITEAGVVHQFIDPLLAALGWPIHDPARYKYELRTQAGHPDMTLIPEQSGTIFYLYQLPVPRLTAGNRFFGAIVPRAARLTCTSAAFADLWQAVMGEAWTPAAGVTDAVERQALRDELDALVAHPYGLTRADFAHILGGFPLVFPDDASGGGEEGGTAAGV